jgi:hypothetical protein
MLEGLKMRVVGDVRVCVGGSVCGRDVCVMCVSLGGVRYQI